MMIPDGIVRITDETLHEAWNQISRYVAGAEMLLTWSEAAFLYLLAKHALADGLVVEIGSWLGGSTRALGIACKERHLALVSIDHWAAKMVDTLSGYETDIFVYWWRNVKIAGLEGTVVPIRGMSDAVAEHWASPIRFLFIDGGHSYEQARSDFLNYSPYVTVGGVVAIHDSWKDGPEQLCKDIDAAPAVWHKIGQAESVTCYERMALDDHAVFMKL